jgi:hypothetical protein
LASLQGLESRPRRTRIPSRTPRHSRTGFIALHLTERDSLDITGRNIRQRGSDYGPTEGNAIPTLRRIEWRE